MKVLIIGSGGREHALAWKVAQSSRVSQIFVAPGNAGTRLEPSTTNVDIAADDVPALLAFAQREQIDLTIVEQATSIGIYADVELYTAGRTDFRIRCEHGRTRNRVEARAQSR